MLPPWPVWRRMRRQRQVPGHRDTQVRGLLTSQRGVKASMMNWPRSWRTILLFWIIKWASPVPSNSAQSKVSPRRKVHSFINLTGLIFFPMWWSDNYQQRPPSYWSDSAATVTGTNRVTGRPPPSGGISLHTSRTQLKQQLQRQQTVEQERRERERQQQLVIMPFVFRVSNYARSGCSFHLNLISFHTQLVPAKPRRSV